MKNHEQASSYNPPPVIGLCLMQSGPLIGLGLVPVCMCAMVRNERATKVATTPLVISLLLLFLPSLPPSNAYFSRIFRKI